MSVENRPNRPGMRSIDEEVDLAFSEGRVKVDEEGMRRAENKIERGKSPVESLGETAPTSVDLTDLHASISDELMGISDAEFDKAVEVPLAEKEEKEDGDDFPTITTAVEG